MKHPSLFDLDRVDPAASIAIAAPGNLQDMADYTAGCRERGIFCIFDPGQSLPAWQGDALGETLVKANMLVSNDYELELIKGKTGLSVEAILGHVDTIITTKGAEGCDVITVHGTTTVPAIATENVVDPTGAGDAFRGRANQGASAGNACGAGMHDGHGVQPLRNPEARYPRIQFHTRRVRPHLECQLRSFTCSLSLGVA